MFCILFIASALNPLLGDSAKLPETLTLDDGTVYEGVRLLSQTPAEIVFMHSGGAKNLEKAALPAKYQRALDYSEADAIAHQKSIAQNAEENRNQAEEQATARREAKAVEQYINAHTFMIRGKIQQIIPEGILIELQEPTGESYFGTPLSKAEKGTPLRFQRYRRSRPLREFGWLFLTAHPEQARFSDGQLIDVDAYREGIQTVGTVTAKRYVFLERY